MYATQNRPETLLNTLNNIIFSYQVMGHLDSAGIYMENVLDQAMESGNHQLQMRVMITMANHLESQGKLDASLSYLQKAMILAPRNADPYHEQGILQNLSRIYKKKGDLKNALTYSERFHAFKDSMVNAESLARISDLELLYESSIKDQQLERQGLQLAKQKDERVLFLVIIGLLLAGTIGIILGLRERMNSRSKLAKQQQLIQDQKIAGLQNENRMISMSSMIKGQEEERSRIAQDLHDGLGGLMATIKSHYATVIDQEGNEELNSKTASLIEQACSEVSRISHNLMPNALAEYGLTEAVTDLAVSLKDGHGMNVEVDFRGMESRLSETEETMIYRIIQELTTNIAKHAKAKSVLIQMLRKNGEALILVEDDGRGFNLEKARSNGGLGIKGLESRVKYLNGNIEFDTVEGEGTTVTINVKLNTAHQNEQFKE